MKYRKNTRCRQIQTGDVVATELLFAKIASTDDLVSLLGSEVVLFLLEEWKDPLDLCASAACSHICNKWKHEQIAYNISNGVPDNKESTNAK